MCFAQAIVATLRHREVEALGASVAKFSNRATLLKFPGQDFAAPHRITDNLCGFSFFSANNLEFRIEIIFMISTRTNQHYQAP